MKQFVVSCEEEKQAGLLARSLARSTDISGAPTGCQEPHTERALRAALGCPSLSK